MSSQTTAGVTTTFGYDGDGKRVWSQLGTDPKKFYIFAGDNLIGEIENGVPSVAYAWSSNGLVSRRDLSAGATYWYYYGPQGETRQITDGTGAVVRTYSYDAYGQVLSQTGTLTNPFRYGGKFGYYSEGTTGFMLAGARWYSPQLKRWISRDPIRYDGGDNLYEYVDSNPIKLIDFTGLAPDLNMLPPGSTGFNQANRSIENPDNPNIVSIAGHGDDNSISGPDGRRYSPDDLANIILGNPTLRQRLMGADTIQLYSCETGFGGSKSFANRLMKALKEKGVRKRVRAPNDMIWLPDGIIAPAAPGGKRYDPTKRGSWLDFNP